MSCHASFILLNAHQIQVVETLFLGRLEIQEACRRVVHQGGLQTQVVVLQTQEVLQVVLQDRLYLQTLGAGRLPENPLAVVGEIQMVHREAVLHQAVLPYPRPPQVRPNQLGGLFQLVSRFLSRLEVSREPLQVLMCPVWPKDQKAEALQHCSSRYWFPVE
jgi:hypothetical protein